MNLSYEKLITTFSEKAKIESDATQIANTLKKAFPNSNLPVSKTIKRFLNGETAHPRESLLGFLAAYVLDKTEVEVIEADKKNSLGEFYKTFLTEVEKQGTITEAPPSVVEAEPNPAVYKIRRDYAKTITIWTLLIVILSLAFYIWFTKKTPKMLLNMQFPTMIPIRGGSYTMGNTFNDTGGNDDEQPCRQITIDGFEMSQTEITFDLFDKYCMARNIPLREDLGWGRDSHPAIMMDWYEAADFCNWLSELQNLKPVYALENSKSDGVRKVISHLENNGYRLPTEAEWEYAAAVDLTTNKKYRFGHHKNTVNGKEVNFNFVGNSGKSLAMQGSLLHNKTVPVFESGMNQNLLYGMAGNVAEWCHDYYHPHFYNENKDAYNPVAGIFVKDSSHLRVLRGGSWEEHQSKIRATFRESSPANSRSELFGFRIVKRQVQEQRQAVVSIIQTNDNQ